MYNLATLALNLINRLTMKMTVLIIAALVVLATLTLVVQNMTTPTHLGHTDGKLAAMPSKPNAVSSQTQIADKQVEALPYKGTKEETLAALKQVLTQMAGNEIQQSEEGYIYSIFTTPKMHYHDDVELLLDEGKQVVHFRSQSRAGYSDRGLNRQRYEQFRTLYLM